MKNLILLLSILTIPAIAFADAFVPEFNNMKTLRCDFVETVYNKDRIVSNSRLFRVYKLDDEYQKIYLQKELIDNIIEYSPSRIEFYLPSMNDDMYMTSHIIIDRKTNEYSATSEITYDNVAFGTGTSQSVGSCKFID